MDNVTKALEEVSLSEKMCVLPLPAALQEISIDSLISSKKRVKQMPDSRRREIEEQIKAQQTDGAKRHMSMVVIGHVDAGKSTIMGHLLHLCGHVDKKTITKYERDSKVQGIIHFSPLPHGRQK